MLYLLIALAALAAVVYLIYKKSTLRRQFSQ